MAHDKHGTSFSSSIDPARSGDRYESEPSGHGVYRDDHDVFGNEADHDIQYRTLSWPFVIRTWQ